MTAQQLANHVKAWRDANPTSNRFVFCTYLAEIGEPIPLTSELMAAWRSFDATRIIDQPATIADAIAILTQDGVTTERGLDAYRYLVECGQANEEVLLSIL